MVMQELSRGDAESRPQHSGVDVEFNVTPGQEPWVDFTFGGSGFQYSEDELRMIGLGSVLAGAMIVREAVGEALKTGDVRKRDTVTSIAERMMSGFNAQERSFQTQRVEPVEAR